MVDIIPAIAAVAMVNVIMPIRARIIAIKDAVITDITKDCQRPSMRVFL